MLGLALVLSLVGKCRVLREGFDIVPSKLHFPKQLAGQGRGTEHVYADSLLLDSKCIAWYDPVPTRKWHWYTGSRIYLEKQPRPS